MNKMGWSIFRNNLLPLVVPGLLIVCLWITGCSTRLYSVNMNYNAEKAVVPAYLKAGEKERNAVIDITEFIDVRNVDDTVIIGRVVDKDGTKTSILPKYTKPTQAVASGVRRYLAKAGYTISVNSHKWDLKEETIPQSDGKLIIGGNINELELICRKGFPTDSYQALIKLTLVLADGAKRKIIYRGSVESNSSLEHVTFSEERLEEQINVAMSDAIEKIFQDKNMAQKLKDALLE